VPELGIDLVEELTLAIDLAPERDQAVAELEPDPAEAVLAPGHPRGRQAVAPRTKSVTAAHRRGLPLLAEEDLAAVVAETLLEPAVTEAAGAWAAVDLAAVAAVAGVEEDFTAAAGAVVAADVAAVGDEKGR
jgi:hypothetical protein